MTSWIATHPGWYRSELELLQRHYPAFWVGEQFLDAGHLCLWGELKVRPPGGTRSHPIAVLYPSASPYEHPAVYPVKSLPKRDGKKSVKIDAKRFDVRHQMPGGNLCLFQREARDAGGDVLTVLQVLRRAEKWFMGLHTGRWPPDTALSELEGHFTYASDVLLAERFFADDVRGRGTFYMIPDLRRVAARSRVYEDGFPMIVTGMTEESGIIRAVDARAELAEVYRWIGSDDWDPLQLADGRQRNRGALNQPEWGYWWTLPVEPAPFHDGAGLLEALKEVAPGGQPWKMVSEVLKGDLQTADRHYFALQYPSRTGGIEWLFLVLPKLRRNTTKDVVQGSAAVRAAFNKLPILCYRVHSIRKADLWRRNETVVDHGVRSKCVALIGLGALGSKVAELLGQAGIGRFRLVDCDIFKPSNATRHIGGVSDFGASKVRVVAGRLQNINPCLRFEQSDLWVGSAHGSRDDLAAFIEAADLVISTTADESVESVLNEVAIAARKPVLYGRALRRASVGRVFLVRPGRDACKRCLSHYAQAGREREQVPPDWIDVVESGDDVLLHECGRPVITGSAADLSFIATLTARAAIDFLEGKGDATNHWVWTHQPGPDLDARLSKPLSTTLGTVPPAPSCPICREPPVIEVVLTPEHREAICSETRSNPTAETGGILLGFVDADRRAIITRVVGPGPRAVKNRARFHRDVEYVQAEIERAEQELGEKGMYVGEWHSHLEIAPEPSPTDVSSLSGIANAPNYLTSNPVMLIAGLDPSAKCVTTVRSWVFASGGRFSRLADV